jgi:hypothetical protein
MESFIAGEGGLLRCAPAVARFLRREGHGCGRRLAEALRGSLDVSDQCGKGAECEVCCLGDSPGEDDRAESHGPCGECAVDRIRVDALGGKLDIG